MATNLRSPIGQFLKGTHWRPHRIFREKEYLLSEYVVKLRPTGDIAREHGVSPANIIHWLKQHNIPRRTTFQSRRIRFGLPYTDTDMMEYQRLLRMAFPEKYLAMRLRDKDKRKQHMANRWMTDAVYREKSAKRNKEWVRAHPKYNSEKIKRYRRQYPERYKWYDKKRQPQKTAYTRERRRTNPAFKIRCILATRLNAALKGKSKSASTIALLGCSIASFRMYLESKFEMGMTWENYGRYPGWHIDHIIPCAIFDLTKPEHQKRCFHFSNMQPMWAADNLSKSRKPATNQFQLL